MSNNDTDNIQEVQEFDAGKVNYEETLSNQLVQANNHFQDRDMIKFCFTIQSIWNNCFEEDRKEIIESVSKMNDKSMNDSILISLPSSDFKSMMNKDLFNRVHLNWMDIEEEYGENTRKKWRRAYQIIQEVLRKKYQGKKKIYEKDKLEG